MTVSETGVAPLSGGCTVIAPACEGADSITESLARPLPGAQPECMTRHSQHPEVKGGHELQDAVERVASGVEQVVIVTDAVGEPLAAIVSVALLRRIDETDTTGEGAQADEADRSGIRFR